MKTSARRVSRSRTTARLREAYFFVVSLRNAAFQASVSSAKSRGSQVASEPSSKMPMTRLGCPAGWVSKEEEQPGRRAGAGRGGEWGWGYQRGAVGGFNADVPRRSLVQPAVEQRAAETAVLLAHSGFRHDQASFNDLCHALAARPSRDTQRKAVSRCQNNRGSAACLNPQNHASP